MQNSINRASLILTSLTALMLNACFTGPDRNPAPSPDPQPDWECVLTDTDPAFTHQIGCRADYEAVSSRPTSVGLPGAYSAKTAIDRIGNNQLYFQNSRKYPIHYDFATAHLSGNGLPIVPLWSEFNATEYTSPDRRFVLGALNYYEGPDIWAYEIAPYDTASAAMIEDAFRHIQQNTVMGEVLTFHPTSDAVARVANKLPVDIPIVTNGDLYADYQPLNLGTSMGQLRFLTQADLEQGNVTFRDIAVLDTIPNDISAVSGIITALFQTPLSHINVLSQNRGTPNMALNGAFEDPELRALEGRWVELTVGPFEFGMREVTKAEADQWWVDNQPDAITIPPLDLTTTELRDVDQLLDVDGLGLGPALLAAIPAYGGKASHFGAFPLIGTDNVPFPNGFAIPVYYYRQFMSENGFDLKVEQMLADDGFQNSPVVRKVRLDTLRDEIKAAPVDPTFLAQVIDKINREYPGTRMRFRSSTNCEDLDGFTGAGLYTSKSGDPNDPAYPVADAIRTVWASVWNFRAFEEREYRSISHLAVGMALLVHRSFPDEEANGVAVTANLFDSSGLEPGFYINVQVGEVSVVIPPEGVTSDQLIFHYDTPGQPIEFMAHSNLVAQGETVLTRKQTAELGAALKEIHNYFLPLYGPSTPDHFYAMDVEFKFDGEPGETPKLFVKQARPYPGWGLNARF